MRPRSSAALARAGAPRRGTRPANRRETILAAAEELFVAKGFPDVSMTEIADAVNVRPSALYRHFSGKEEILVEVISRGVELRIDSLTAAAHHGVDEVLTTLVDQTLTRSANSLLWTIHGRSLRSEMAMRLRAQVRRYPDALAQWLGDLRPELTSQEAHVLAWAGLDVLTSSAFHDERLSTVDYQRVLVATMRRVLWVDLPPAGLLPAPPTPRTVPDLRGEQLLSAAADLFARHGYHAVTLDDLGAAVGMAGANVYAYVESKQQLLDLVMTRSLEWLECETRRHLAPGQSALERLHAHIAADVEFTAVEPALVRILLTERFHVSSRVEARLDLHHRELVQAWVELLRQVHPELDPAEARVVVMAARMIPLDMLTTRTLRQLPGIVEYVSVLVERVLDV